MTCQSRGRNSPHLNYKISSELHNDIFLSRVLNPPSLQYSLPFNWSKAPYSYLSHMQIVPHFVNTFVRPPLYSISKAKSLPQA